YLFYENKKIKSILIVINLIFFIKLIWFCFYEWI
ncbi:putative membrane protein, partial [Yersinia pestis PY-52]